MRLPRKVRRLLRSAGKAALVLTVFVFAVAAVIALGFAALILVEYAMGAS